VATLAVAIQAQKNIVVVDGVPLFTDVDAPAKGMEQGRHLAGLRIAVKGVDVASQPVGKAAGTRHPVVFSVAPAPSSVLTVTAAAWRCIVPRPSTFWMLTQPPFVRSNMTGWTMTNLPKAHHFLSSTITSGSKIYGRVNEEAAMLGISIRATFLKADC